MRDLIIIGAGPAGISAAIYAKRANLDVLVIEKDMPCSKLTTLNKIDNYPGVKSISGADLAMSFFSQLLDLKIELVTDTISEVIKEEDKFIIKGNKTYESKKVILATGLVMSKSFTDIDKYLNKGVSTCVTCDGAFYKDKVVAYIGNNNDDIAYLKNIVDKLYVFNKVDNLKIEGKDKVEKLYINNQEYSVDGIFVERSFNSSSIILPELDKTGSFIKVNENYESSVAGLYAIGDISNNPLKQIVTATASGAIAATDVIKKRQRTK